MLTYDVRLEYPYFTYRLYKFSLYYYECITYDLRYCILSIQHHFI